jgi:hypothetical protein
MGINADGTGLFTATREAGLAPRYQRWSTASQTLLVERPAGAGGTRRRTSKWTRAPAACG